MADVWATLVALLTSLLLTAFVAVDRNRIRRRLDAAEGALTGLRLDLAAARDHIAELSSRADSRGDSKGDNVPDRWSPAPGQGVQVSESRRISGS